MRGCIFIVLVTPFSSSQLCCLKDQNYMRIGLGRPFLYDSHARLPQVEQYVNGAANDLFVEKGLTYDLNGNISTLQRTGNGAMGIIFRMSIPAIN